MMRGYGWVLDLSLEIQEMSSWPTVEQGPKERRVGCTFAQ